MFSRLLFSVLFASLAWACETDFDCSLNGVCTGGSCACDSPWTGVNCTSLSYSVTPASGKNLWQGAGTSSNLNTWNGPTFQSLECYLHRTAAAVEGPYDWTTEANISLTGINPGGLVFPNATTGANVYSLWDGGSIYIADSPYGPWVKSPYTNPKSSNPAPAFFNGAFYIVDQGMGTILTSTSLAGPWTVYAKIALPHNPYTVEDPFFWFDPRGNMHIINHAYNTGQFTNCSDSWVSSHSFSSNGNVWGHTDQPYGHTVEFDDGTNHSFCTLERPYLVIDAAGLITHIHLAADLVTGDGGCGKTPCVNCKYADHAGTLLVKLGA